MNRGDKSQAAREQMAVQEAALAAAVAALFTYAPGYAAAIAQWAPDTPEADAWAACASSFTRNFPTDAALIIAEHGDLATFIRADLMGLSGPPAGAA